MAKNEIQTTGVNTICDETVINGDIIAKNDLRIDGYINGNLVTTGRVVVGTTGIITGDIRCSNIEILGAVHGDIEATDIVTIKGDAKVDGNITTKRLSVEPGIFFNGTCKMSNSDSNNKE